MICRYERDSDTGQSTRSGGIGKALNDQALSGGMSCRCRGTESVSLSNRRLGRRLDLQARWRDWTHEAKTGAPGWTANAINPWGCGTSSYSGRSGARLSHMRTSPFILPQSAPVASANLVDTEQAKPYLPVTNSRCPPRCKCTL